MNFITDLCVKTFDAVALSLEKFADSISSLPDVFVKLLENKPKEKKYLGEFEWKNELPAPLDDAEWNATYEEMPKNKAMDNLYKLDFSTGIFSGVHLSRDLTGRYYGTYKEKEAKPKKKKVG
jgi:hypothetical protein